MPDKEPVNFNIFGPGLSSFNAIIDRFRRLSELAAPLSEIDSGGIRLFTIPLYKDKNSALLPAFTDSRLLKPPLVVKPPLEFLKLLFHSQSPDLFSFNPPGYASEAAGAEIRLSRQQLSLIIGALEAGPAPDNAPRSAGQNLKAAGAHAAHYLASLSAADPAADFLKAEALVELDLFQEAYELIKGGVSPQVLCLMAAIYRKTGNAGKARNIVSAVPESENLGRKRELETAWLELEDGRPAEAERAFAAMAGDPGLRQEALFGLAMAKAALSSKGTGSSGINDTARAFEAALENPAKASAKTFFCAGNFFLRSGLAARAENCYRRSAGLLPSVSVRANLCLALLREAKTQEAAFVAAGLSLTEPASAGRLAAQFPKDAAPALFENAFQSLVGAQAGGITGETILSLDAATPKMVISSRNAVPAAPEPANSSKQSEIATPLPMDRAAGRGNPNSGPPGGESRAREGMPEVQLETFKDLMSASGATQEETKNDSFLSNAFKLASDLEDEFGEKIYFNADGLTQVERKLRLTFMKGRNNPQDTLNTVKDCSAFLCYVLQERFKGRLLKLQDFDPWGWPMIFERPGAKVTSYPVERVWKLLWEGGLPDPGWLIKYLHYLEDELHAAPGSRQRGADAVRSKTMSRTEKITEAQTEHKRILILVSTLVETGHIETGRTGLPKLEQILKNNFHRDIPPTVDGWKLLRCYGHLFTSIIVKDFKASWYNVEGSDGLWSMQTPWKTYIFPLGKVYKAASSGESLVEYYNRLEEEKLKYTAQIR